MKVPETYRLLETKELKEIGGTGHVLEHIKSGAHLFVIETEDDNKVFFAGFRTIPEDDTGVPHILEHTVLSGSEKYPVKDPMGELTGSLRTFMNAMTYPDKTVYPIASTNLKSFKNLMEVYTDAVFHPLIYKSPLGFFQEGWHYELELPEDPLTVNGIVYNEMKGDFSASDNVLARKIQNDLFPDTGYAFESGGDPEAIPDLSYEEFLEFHRRFYHPSNAYIYLYGDMDMEERLLWLDQECLQYYDAIDPKTEISLQAPFEKVREDVVFCEAEDEDDDEGCSFAWAKVVEGLEDPASAIVYEALEYALIESSGAPVKEALVKAGIGKEIYGGYVDEIRQPYFEIIAKGCREEDKERFVSIIEETLEKVIREGIPDKTILAAVNNSEFTVREAEYGYPKGLVYGLDAMAAWIHGLDPMMMLQFDEDFKTVRSLVGTGYFEKVIREKLLDNPFGIILTEIPKEGLIRENEKKLEEKLAGIKAALTDEEIRHIVEETEELKRFQSEPSSPEALETIPVLDIEDIGKEIRPFINEERRIGDAKVLYHNVNTSGISYVDFLFSSKTVKTEDLPLLLLWKGLLSLLSTENYTYSELFDELLLKTGGFRSTYLLYEAGDDFSLNEAFAVQTKFLTDETKAALELVEEILLRTEYSDTDRIRELLEEKKSQAQQLLVAGGHATAARRVLSGTGTANYLDEKITGIEAFRHLEAVLEHFDETKEALPEAFVRFGKEIFTKRELLISFTGSEEAYKAFAEAAGKLLEALPEGKVSEDACIVRKAELFPVREGIKTVSQVQYNAMGGNARLKGYPYTGAYNVLRAVLGSDYLWNRLRVLGGAYGCFSTFKRNGDMVFASYRDPAVAETLEVYRELPEYLRNYEADEREMTKNIIGAINGMDAPLSPQQTGTRSLYFYLYGLPESVYQTEREQVLSCTPENLRALAEPIEAVLKDNMICVLGNADVIEENREIFDRVMTLSKEEA